MGRVCAAGEWQGSPPMRVDALLDEFADALMAVSLDGIILYWSRGAEAVFGWTSAEAVGKPLVELIVGIDHREEATRGIDAVVERGAATFETVRQRKDGTPVHVDVSMRAVRDDAGGVTHIAISKKDVSHLKYLREAGALEARFGGLLDAAPDAMVLVNESGRIVMVNREAERLFGFSREELIGRLVDTLVPDRARAAHPGHRAAYASDPRTRPMGAGLDLAARRKDGSEFPAEISLSRVQLAEGQFTSAAIRDVSLRRKVEAKFRGLLEAAPDAIVIVDESGRIVLVNAQAERLFGYERTELIGRLVDILVPARDHARHVEHRADYFRDPRARAMGSGLGLKAVRKDGTQFPVEISLSPLETEEGLLVSSAIRDVTQRVETENALKLAYKELESFSYSVAHDLRAPLRGMNGFAQILLSDYRDKLSVDGLDCLLEIRNNAVRMGALIDALLSLSRVSRTELRRERVDLGAFVQTAVAACSSIDPGRVVEVKVQEGLSAWADPPLLRTLVENLIGNAWKFTSGTEHARIEVGVRDSDGQRAFFVRDNGAGFDMGYVERLFGPFQRLHAESEFPGTGIGLATAQRIVHRHGGRIWAEGAVGKGATIHFTLPGEQHGVRP